MSSSPDIPTPNNSTPDKGRSNQSSGSTIDPFELFERPTPGFDPSDNADILKFYEKRRGAGTVIENEPEDSIEAIADSKIADLKKLREVSPEEEKRLRARIREMESGRWLEAAKVELVGKSTAPIEYFNRLVAENEEAIGYVARHTARSNKAIQDRNARIRELQGQIKTVEDQKTAEKDAKASDDQKSTTDSLEQENADLKTKLEECQAHGNQSDAQIKELQAALAAEKLASSNKKTDESKDEKNIQDLKTQIATLQGELKTSRETSSRHYNRVQELLRTRKEGLDRENNLKNYVRKADQDAKDLGKQIDNLTERVNDLTKQLANADTKGSTEKDKSSGAADKKLKDDNAKLLKENQVLRDEVDRLSKNTYGTNADGRAQIKNLTDALAVQNQRNQELRAQNRALEAERHNWIGTKRITDPEWWAQVEEITKLKRSLDVNVLALFRRLGFGDENLDGEAAVARLNAALDEMATPDGRHPLMPTLLRYAGEVQAALRAAAAARRRADELEDQVDCLRSRRSARTEREYLAELRLFEDEDLERRVDARTEMYTRHRRQYLNNFFGASRRLGDIAAACADAPTRNAINTVRQQFLSVQSLPNPVAARPPR